jgi:hypothetical protein
MSSTSGSLPLMNCLPTSPQISAPPGRIVSAKNADALHVAATSSFTLFAAITPTAGFSSRATASTSSRPPGSSTPTEPNRRLTGPLICMFFRANSA